MQKKVYYKPDPLQEKAPLVLKPIPVITEEDLRNKTIEELMIERQQAKEKVITENYNTLINY